MEGSGAVRGLFVQSSSCLHQETGTRQVDTSGVNTEGGGGGGGGVDYYMMITVGSSVIIPEFYK